MLRFSPGVSSCFTLLAVLGALGACSSESTEGAGQGGSASAAGSGSGGSDAAASGTGGTTGGTPSNGTGGTPPANGGSSTGNGGRAGSSSVAGSGSGSCTPGVVTCVDDTTAATCDDNGMTITVDCVADLPEIGLISTGCQGDATEGNCNGEPSDAACLDGATVFAICNAFTQEQFFNTYVNCFQDNNDLQTPIRCVGPFLAASGTEADCAGAVAACEDELGAGGAGGAGG
jgi:hypothetical protein